MRKRTLIICFMFLSSCVLTAQAENDSLHGKPGKWFIGFFGSKSFAYRTITDGDYAYVSKPGVQSRTSYTYKKNEDKPGSGAIVGFRAQRNFSRWFLTFGLFYEKYQYGTNKVGVTYRYTWNDINGAQSDTLYNGYKCTYYYQFLSVPVGVNYKFFNGKEAYFYAGIECAFSKLLTNKISTIDYINDVNLDFSWHEIPPTFFCTNAKAGLGWRTSDNILLSLDLFYNYTLTSFNEDTPTHLFQYGVLVGMSFRIK